MLNLSNFQASLSDLKKIAYTMAQKSTAGTIFLLQGELGSGKTTFARFLIHSFFKKNSLSTPKFIKSPSFPILINYSLDNFSIYHYDFYRLKNKNEFNEIEIFENLENNVTIIEWPEIFLNNFSIDKYLLINFEIISPTVRKINVSKI